MVDAKDAQETAASVLGSSVPTRLGRQQLHPANPPTRELPQELPLADAHIQHQPLKMPGKVQKRLCLERQINENQMEGWLHGVDRTSAPRV